MEYRPILPVFYQRPVPLNSGQHSAATLANTGYLFAARAHSVVLGCAEFADACRCFPILFASGEDRTVVLPVALLGLQNGENLFVGTEGEWLGSYIPAYIRRYPFIPASGEGNEPVVFIDEACEGLNREGGEALFEDGQPSNFLQKMLRLMADFQAQMATTESFSRELQTLQIMKPVTASVELNDGRQFSLNDFMVVDEAKLLKVGGEELERLFRSGHLALIYAHLSSLRSMQWLVDRKAAILTQPLRRGL